MPCTATATRDWPIGSSISTIVDPELSSEEQSGIDTQDTSLSPGTYLIPPLTWPTKIPK